MGTQPNDFRIKNVNGHLTPTLITQQKGLRQEDPLSPLLYNIAFDPSILLGPGMTKYPPPPSRISVIPFTRVLLRAMRHITDYLSFYNTTYLIITLIFLVLYLPANCL